MRKSKFSEEQNISILAEQERGMSTTRRRWSSMGHRSQRARQVSNPRLRKSKTVEVNEGSKGLRSVHEKFTNH